LENSENICSKLAPDVEYLGFGKQVHCQKLVPNEKSIDIWLEIELLRVTGDGPF